MDRSPKAVNGWRFLYPLVRSRSGQEELQIKALEQLWTADVSSRPRYDRELSELYFGRDDFDDAQKTLLRATSGTPTDAALWYRLGEVEVKMRKDASAAGRFAKAYQLLPSNAVYARTYGQTVTTKDGIKATLALWRFLSQQNATPEERLKYAQSLFLNNDFAGSAQQWDALVKANADLARTEPMVAESYLKSGQLVKARSILEDRLGSEANNIQLLEQVASLYKQSGDNAGYLKTLERITQADPKYKGYLLVLAQEKEKAKDFKGALELTEQWVGKTPGDMTALESMHRLAEQVQDTARLVDALVRLNREKNVANRYRFQMAEIDYARGGGLAGVEKLEKAHPEWTRGKEILVREYLKQNQKAKLGPYLPFLEAQSHTDKNLLEPLGDVYAAEKKNPQANAAYWGWLQANPKNRTVYDKVTKFGKSTASPFMNDILRLGYQNFSDDADLQREYAASLGNTPQALSVYQGLIAKEADVATLEKAVALAIALRQFALAGQWLDKWSTQSPADVKVWDAVYAVAQQTGNKAKQLEALEKISTLKPDRKDALQRLGQAYEEQRQPEKAVESYKKLITLDPRNRDVLRKLKVLLAGQVRQEELKQVLIGVEVADPTAHETQFDLARIFNIEGDKEKAYAYLAKALKLQPQNPEYQALLPSVVTKDEQALLYLPALEKQALMPGAKPELEYMVARGYMAKKNTAAAVRLLVSVYSKNPRLLEGNRDAILALHEAKQYAQAGALATKFLAQNPADKEVRTAQVEGFLALGKGGPEMREALSGLMQSNPEAGAKHLYRLAELDLQARDSAAALAHAKAFVARNLKSLEAWRMVYSLAKGRTGEEEAYRQSLEQLSVLDPAGRGHYERELADLQFQRGNFDDAQKILLRATAANAHDAALWFKLGDVEMKLRKDASAAQRYAKAYEIEPSNLVYARAYSATVISPEAVKATLPLWKLLSARGPTVEERRKLAQSLFLNGDYMGSAREWDWLLQGDSTLARSEPMVAQAYLRSGQYAKARVIVQERLKSDPTNLELLDGMVNLTHQEGNPATYLKALDALVLVNPKYKNYQLLLAQEKEKAKDAKGALEQYDQFIARTGGDLSSLQAMHRLADQVKDTVRLVEALVRLNRDKNVDLRYRFQMAAVDYARGGTIEPVEKLVKAYPTFREGRMILVKAYLKKRDVVKLAPHIAFIEDMAREDRSWSEAVGDVYVQMKKADKANEAYFAAFVYNKKDKTLFDKVYDFAKKTNSPYRLGLLKQGFESFPDDADLKFDFAESQGKTQRALDIYNEILAKDKNHLPSLRNAAEVTLALGRTEQAQALIERWSETEPQNPRPWTLLADIYKRGRNDAKLAEVLDKISGLTPKDAKAAYAAAQAYRKIGEKAKAVEFLTRAATLDPQNGDYQKEYGLLLAESGQLNKAKPALLAADKRFPGDEAINKALYEVAMSEKDSKSARERMKALYTLKPYNKAYSISLGRLEAELGNTEDMVRILSNPMLRDTLDAKLAFILLDGYFKTGQRDRAGLLGPQLLQKYPEEAKKSLPLAILFYDQKNRARAKEILEAFTGDNNSPEGFYYLGKIRYEEKNWRGAADALEHAMKFKPDAMTMLGEAYVQSGDATHAINVYEDFYAKSKDAKVLEQLYALYKKARDNDGIAKTLERLLATDGHNLDYRSELASFYLAGGNAKKAQEQFEQILKVNPSHPQSNLVLGMMLAARKDWGPAARMLEIGTSRYPDSGAAWRSLGDARRALKQPLPALQAYKRAMKLLPQSRDLVVARMELVRELNLSSELPDAYAEVLKIDPDNLEANAALAAARFQERKYPEAAELYAKVVDKKPDDKQAWVNYGAALLEIKKIPEAKQALQRAVDLGVKDARMLTNLARIYKEEGNVEKAEQLLGDLVKKDPHNHWALFGLGQIAADRNQSGVAEGYFRKAYQAASGNGEYAEALARLLASKDECGQALPILESARTSLTVKGRLLYGECLLKTGKEEAAMAQIKAVYDQEPTPEVLAKLADLNLARGNIREAIRLLEGSSAQSDTNIQFITAKAQLANNQPGKARSILDALISDNRNNAGYYYNRGLSWFQDRDWSRAQKDFDQALKFNDDLLDASYYIGICLLKQGKATDAQNYFKELSQNRNPTWQAKGFHGMAMAFDADHKLDAAENYLLKSLAAKETSDALSMLGRVYLRERKPPLAEKQARRALEIKPDDPSAIAVLCEVLMAQGRKEEALQMANKALQQNPNSCELNLGAAKIHFLAGNYESSRQSGMYAINNCPDDPGGYFFVALISVKKYNKEDAKRYFRDFVKHGGDAKLVPQEYR